MGHLPRSDLSASGRVRPKRRPRHVVILQESGPPRNPNAGVICLPRYSPAHSKQAHQETVTFHIKTLMFGTRRKKKTLRLSTDLIVGGVESSSPDPTCVQGRRWSTSHHVPSRGVPSRKKRLSCRDRTNVVSYLNTLKGSSGRSPLIRIRTQPCWSRGHGLKLLTLTTPYLPKSISLMSPRILLNCIICQIRFLLCLN